MSRPLLVAVGLAVEYPPAALVLRSPFTSMADVGQHHYPLLPVRLLLRDRFVTIDRIPRIGAPLLIIDDAGDRPFGSTVEVIQKQQGHGDRNLRASVSLWLVRRV